MLTTPAEAFLPNSVPCGPLSTSTRWTSPSESNACACCTTGRSSTMTATLGSTPIEKAKVPMPRRMIELLGDDVACVTVSDEAARVRSVKSVTRLFARASADSAVTETGTFWRFSSRFCAVTTISSRPPVSSATAASAGAAASCAKAGAAKIRLAVASNANLRTIGFLLPCRESRLLATFSGKANYGILERPVN